MSRPLLSIQGLKTQFNQSPKPVKAVDGVSLDIHEGETFALVGESGCGKSVTALTALRLLPSNAEVTAGHVFYKGIDLLRLPEMEMRKHRGARISMIFQDPMTSLNPVMSVGEQIAEAVLAHDNVVASELKNSVVQLIKQVGIADAHTHYDSFPHQLSGGMRQRVLIAIALASDPDLLIADEPTTALDVTIQSQILQLLKDLQRERGMSLWIITHDLGIVSQIADTVGVMYAGQLVEVASRDTFFKRPSHPYSQRLFDAIPKMDRRDKALVTLPGFVPSLSEPFKGCRFADRCEFSEAACTSSDIISWLVINEQHKVRCRRAAEIDITATNIAVDSFDLNNIEGHSLYVNDLKVHFPIKKGFLKRTVGQVKAVDGISFELQPATTTALVGESGCGKTTLAKALLRLLPITSGEILYKGEDLATVKERDFQVHRQELQIIFQDPFSSMNPRMLVADILEEGLRAQQPNLDDASVYQRCNELLIKVGLDSSVRLRYPHEFSGGQRQRLCIARALAVEPSIIVCDEPTSALDVSVQAQVLNLLKKLQHEKGLSYLFITHDLSVVSYIADQVAVMYLGRIVEYGSVDDVLNNPAHPYTKALIEAVPNWDESVSKKVIKLPDNMPSPADPPQGCHFNTRCAQVMPACKEAYPAAVNISSSHRVNCLLFSTASEK
ncbi:MAG: ABC transporter ATP-binding protein [Piscirickettsiaceae bacterium]|nr:MAG: ABC transporter ATP-binding protein [Piscirickettsiaceae bacterium]